MGDQIEFTTWPRHQNIFYKITSSAIVVEIKALGNAAIGLAKEPGTTCDFWIVIGDRNTRSWIKKDGDHSKHTNTQNILSLDEYKKFWITWYGDSVQVGEDGVTTPILSYSSNIPDIQYVTYSVMGERNYVCWRCELPPERQTKSLRSVSGGNAEWIPSVHQLPDGAMIGGYERENLYIIRAHHRRSLTPGKFVPSEGLGYISWGGNAHEKNEFEVLCGYNMIWMTTSHDRIPVGAIVGGSSEDRGETLYIGRAMHEGHLIPGKVQPSHRCCYISYEDKEIAKENYEILVKPDKNRDDSRIMVPNVFVDSADESDHDE